MLGVHPNTVRAWSDAGRLRYYRINPRGDRRYRLGDLQRFLAAAESGGADDPIAPGGGPAHNGGPSVRRGGHHPALGGGTPPPAPDREHHRGDLQTLSALARLAADPGSLDTALSAAAWILHDLGSFLSVSVQELRDGMLAIRATTSDSSLGVLELRRSHPLFDAALDPGQEGAPVMLNVGELDALVDVPAGSRIAAVAIPGDQGPWGVLVVAADGATDPSAVDPDFVGALAGALGAIVAAARRAEDVSHTLHRTDALRRVAADIGSRLDLDRILAGLVDHAMVLFDADRAGVFLSASDGQESAAVTRGLSQRYLQAVRDFPVRSLPAPRGGRSSTDVRHELPRRCRGATTSAPPSSRRGSTRSARRRSSTARSCSACSTSITTRRTPGPRTSSRRWRSSPTRPASRSRTPRTSRRWPPGPPSSSRSSSSGARLSRLTDEHEIGIAIATELRQLIDYHNVRVYRLRGEDLIPVAMQGQVGEYVDETPDQLAVKFGQGITGWVAEHRVAQNLPDAGADPRANTIPGTDDDLDESMLLAPMLYEDQVLGVLVLSKLGLHQFSDDDLRLLVIYASFAAQAMANADATGLLRAQSEALGRQLAQPARAPARSPSRS